MTFGFLLYRPDVANCEKILTDNNINYKKSNYFMRVMIEINVENIVFFEKKFSKKNIEFELFDYVAIVCKLLKNKLFEDVDYLMEKYPDEDTNDIMTKVCREYDIECVKYILHFAYADYEFGNSHEFFREICCRKGDRHDILQILFDHEIESITKNASTENTKKENKILLASKLSKIACDCLYCACEEGNYNIARLSREYILTGKNCSDCVSAALEYNNTEIAQYLIGCGFSYVFKCSVFIASMKNPNSREELVYFYANQLDSKGKTILNRPKTLAKGFIQACQFGHLETVMALVEIGVDVDKYKSRALSKSRERKEIQTFLKKLE